MFTRSLMSLTSESLAFSTRTNFKKFEAASSALNISSSFQVDEARESIIEKPPKVTKMTYCSVEASQAFRKRDQKLFRKASNSEECTFNFT